VTGWWQPTEFARVAETAIETRAILLV